MQYLFSEPGEALLRAFAQAPCLAAFDFDGTLAPIVPTPGEARLKPGTSRLLERLCPLAPVAVITGRSLGDVRPRVPDGLTYLVGNHGIEGPTASDAQRAGWRRDCRTWLAGLTAALPGRLDPATVIVEDKGLTLSVHYRHAADTGRTERVLRELFALLAPAPRVVAGKFVFNLVPREAPTKREALQALVQHSGARNVLFAGDDVTDEDVFVGAPAEWLTLRVEPSTDSAARWYLREQREIDGLLTRLVTLLASGTRARAG